jgi:hypothetical protein
LEVVLTTDQKGAIAESAVTHEAIKLGLNVYRPLVEGGRYDLILEAGTALLRVQCSGPTSREVQSWSAATRLGEAVAA